ncbi:molybdenum cofactor guanylyltransferase [Alloacidobacterium dinghuense]|uniref:Probable molybdenum cofactor guanylyltransferase n=1 Tax=Alloacidobacterium dinghuense TaxID=2763107 RepID=A0A7G8BN00_9BACT|nr:molybdenum cofactor guanylyltransferase [Alloacidobacterium dinghuense]QNI33920.1 molybdenum cofactor guanylyltransferase [Alloacidobacterium dinghuense]
MNGFVLAGGRSTRMGRDKALLPYAGRPLIAHAVDLLKMAGVEPHIVGARPDLAAYAPVIEDLHPGCGPLGGIEAALAASSSELNLFLPVDLPLLPAAFLRYLLQRAEISGADATMPTWGGGPEPLCAIYCRDLLAGIRESLASGNYKVMHAVENAVRPSEVDLFSVEAVAATRDDWPLDPPLRRWFQNLNTPAELALVS